MFTNILPRKELVLPIPLEDFSALIDIVTAVIDCKTLVRLINEHPYFRGKKWEGQEG